MLKFLVLSGLIISVLSSKFFDEFKHSDKITVFDENRRIANKIADDFLKVTSKLIVHGNFDPYDADKRTVFGVSVKHVITGISNLKRKGGFDVVSKHRGVVNITGVVRIKHINETYYWTFGNQGYTREHIDYVDVKTNMTHQLITQLTDFEIIEVGNITLVTSETGPVVGLARKLLDYAVNKNKMQFAKFIQKLVKILFGA